MKTIFLLIVATNKYVDFVQPLINSADKFFLKDHNVSYVIFSDQEFLISSSRKYHFFKIDHEPWPKPTLKRFNYFLKSEELIQDSDYCFYVDADALFVSEINEEVLGDRVGVQHCKFLNGVGEPDRNPLSTAYIPETEKNIYCVGHFLGGRTDLFLIMSKQIARNVEIDEYNNVTARWHDESHCNKYYLENPITKFLPPSYAYPQNWNLPYTPKILSLMKNNTILHK